MTKMQMADKTNMDIKTAKKYLDLTKLPSQVKVEHNWRTRKDPFEEIWEESKDLLKNNPGLEAKSLFEYFQKNIPKNSVMVN